MTNPIPFRPALKLPRFLLALLPLIQILALGCGTTSPNWTPTPNPLITTYTVNAPANSSVVVEFGPTTAYGQRTSAHPAPSGGGELNIIVAGMKPSTTYHMRARITAQDGSTTFDDDRTFKTGPLNTDRFPVLTVSGNTAAGRGIQLLNMPALPGELPGPRIQAFATDLAGNIIWYYDHDPNEGSVFPIKPLSNGNMLLVLSDYKSRSTVREIDLAGNSIRELKLFELNAALASRGYQAVIRYLHHDMLSLPNAHTIVLGSEFRQVPGLAGFTGDTTVEADVIVDLDPNFQPVWVWNAFDHLDLNRHPMNFPADWTHGNALTYTPDGNLLISLRHQHWVLKLDYANGAGTGNVLWRLGHEGDFTLTNGGPADWFYAQHLPFIISADGPRLTLAIYDNGNNRPGDIGPCGEGAGPCQSRAVVYSLDESTRTATIIWEYNTGLFTPWGGSVAQLPNGNRELALPAPVQTGASRILEVTPSSTPTPVWQMDVSIPLTYRANRIPSLYPGVTW